MYKFENGLTYDEEKRTLSYNGKQSVISRGYQNNMFEILIRYELHPEMGILTHSVMIEELRKCGVVAYPENLKHHSYKLNSQIRELMGLGDKEEVIVKHRDIREDDQDKRECGWRLTFKPVSDINDVPAIQSEENQDYFKEYYKAQDFYNNGHVEKALTIHRKLAGLGYLRSINTLGVMIAKGQGTPRSMSEGLKLIQDAADKGLSQAQLNIGLAYSSAHGKPFDHQKAFLYFKLAAENPIEPDCDAMVWLSQSYRDGVGTEKDLEKAKYWADRARELDADPDEPINYWAQP